MKMITTDQARLIEDVQTEGMVVLSPGMLEKDLMIVEALRAIAAVNIEGVAVTFFGGTCLAKAHRLLERMSEDVDLRITLREPSALTRSSGRTCLSNFKSAVATAMREAQFHIPDKAIRARNDNQFIAFDLEYGSRFEPENALRPALRVEFSAIPPRRPTTMHSIRPLVDELMNETTVAAVELACLSVEETYCEKIISYLRRATEYIAGRARCQYEGRLARHVYDVHCIITLRYLEPLPSELFAELIVAETVRYGNRDLRFARKPTETLRRTLARIDEIDLFRIHYDEFASELIYAADKPTFDESFATFRSIALRLLNKCKRHLPELMVALDKASSEATNIIH